jgi:hypothetical protein
MATLSRQTLTEAGLTPTYNAANAGGDQVDNSDGRTFLHVKNASGGSITITIAEQISGTTVEDPALGTLTKTSVAKAVAAGAEAVIGPFKKAAFNDVNGFIQLTYSGVTTFTVAAFKFP